MLRQKAFTGENKFLKGGLHCHTKRSDGWLSPEDTEKMHKEHGYDFLALTDHRYYNYADYAPELGLTIIPGMEFDADIYNQHGHGFRCIHTVCLGPDDETNGFKQDDRFKSGKISDQFDMQEYVNWIRSKNNICFYCHPQWSSTPTRFFDKIEGFIGMELWNTGCVKENLQDVDNGWQLDELISLGHKDFVGVAVDDGHRPEHHCGGWVMVNSENNVKAILTALQEGAFYSSTGADLYDVYVEDNKAHVKCSPAAAIQLCCDKHPNMMQTDREGNLTEATFDLDWNHGYTDYIRIHIIDKDGKQAWSNPLWLK